MTRRNRPIELMDSPEHRTIPLERIEMRSDSGNDNEIILEGYASTFDEYEMYGGPSQYGWIERMDPQAFDVTLREKPDLHLLINHSGMPLARTKSGNLDLCADPGGLKVVARLDKRDPEVQSLAVKMERGDMDEMSFAFRVKAQEWRAAPGYEDLDDESYRTITEVSLHKGDVSVVNWGANSTTSVGIRSAADALKVLAECDESELAEVRAEADVVNLKVAQERLTAIRAGSAVLEDEEVEEVEEEDEGADTVEVPVYAEALAEAALLEVFKTLTERLEALEGAVVEVEAEADAIEEEPEVEEGLSDRLVEALAAQGILPETLTLAAALAAQV